MRRYVAGDQTLKLDDLKYVDRGMHTAVVYMQQLVTGGDAAKAADECEELLAIAAQWLPPDFSLSDAASFRCFLMAFLECAPTSTFAQCSDQHVRFLVTAI